MSPPGSWWLQMTAGFPVTGVGGTGRVLDLEANVHPTALKLQGIFFFLDLKQLEVGDGHGCGPGVQLAEDLWLSILLRSRQMASGDTAVSQDVVSCSGPLRRTRGRSLHVQFEFGARSRAAPGANPAG